VSYQGETNVISFQASATITEFQLVKRDSDGYVLPCNSDEDVPVGIAQRGAVSGDQVEVCVGGISFARAGGTLTLGTHQALMATTSGQLIAYDGSGSNTQIACAEFIGSSSAVANDQILVIYRGAVGIQA
jgi:hypothetical protein